MSLERLKLKVEEELASYFAEIIKSEPSLNLWKTRKITVEDMRQIIQEVKGKHEALKSEGLRTIVYLYYAKILEQAADFIPLMQACATLEAAATLLMNEQTKCATRFPEPWKAGVLGLYNQNFDMMLGCVMAEACGEDIFPNELKEMILAHLDAHERAQLESGQLIEVVMEADENEVQERRTTRPGM